MCIRDRVRRSYSLPLSAVMDSYEALYRQDAYKEGTYRILSQEPGQVKQIMYREADQVTDCLLYTSRCV